MATPGRPDAEGSAGRARDRRLSAAGETVPVGLSRLLGASPWFGGAAVGLADLHLAPVMAYVSGTPEGVGLIAAQPGLTSWWGRMSERPSMASTQPQFGLRARPSSRFGRPILLLAGAAEGLGASVAKMFAAAGHDVLGLARSDRATARLTNWLARPGVNMRTSRATSRSRHRWPMRCSRTRIKSPCWCTTPIRC